MKTYILRRLLLMPITLLGVTFIVFCVTRFVPGGPIEQQLQQQALGAVSGQKSAQDRGDSGLSESSLERLEEQYGLQEPIIIAYLQWLGILPREVNISYGEFNPQEEWDIAEDTESAPTQITQAHLGKDNTLTPTSLVEQTSTLSQSIAGTKARVLLKGIGKEVLVERASTNSTEVSSVVFFPLSSQDSRNIQQRSLESAQERWYTRIESPRDRAERWGRRVGESDPAILEERSSRYFWRAVLYKQEFDGLLQGSLGTSFKYNESVWGIIRERIPISLYFGVLTAILTYSVCIPLGIVKAIRHKTWVDNITSVMIFVGYSVPGFALGAILVVYLGARLEWFPISGLMSQNFQELGLFEKIKDLAWHTVLPLLCYVVGSFALLTMMMKNTLMDNLSADYVRTAMAKGLSFHKAILLHAFRNSFIPIATTLGGLLCLLVSGSLLIERMFDIQGFGMLSFQAVMDKDYGLIMGTLTLSALLIMLGSLLSDIIISLIDPRIKFH